MFTAGSDESQHSWPGARGCRWRERWEFGAAAPLPARTLRNDFMGGTKEPRRVVRFAKHRCWGTWDRCRGEGSPMWGRGRNMNKNAEDASGEIVGAAGKGVWGVGARFLMLFTSGLKIETVAREGGVCRPWLSQWSLDRELLPGRRLGFLCAFRGPAGTRVGCLAPAVSPSQAQPSGDGSMRPGAGEPRGWLPRGRRSWSRCRATPRPGEESGRGGRR